MEIKLSIEIFRSVGQVFDFLRDFENHHQEKKTQVLLVEKLTPGPSSIGSRYRETVQMLPLVKSVFITEITRFEPSKTLEFTWSGGGMTGVLEYMFNEIDDRTKLDFSEWIHPRGIIKLAGPIIQASFTKTMTDRLEGIKRHLEKELNQ